MMNDPNCINPCNGREGGDTWARRMERVGQPFESEALKSPSSAGAYQFSCPEFPDT